MPLSNHEKMEFAKVIAGVKRRTRTGSAFDALDALAEGLSEAARHATGEGRDAIYEKHDMVTTEMHHLAEDIG